MLFMTTPKDRAYERMMRQVPRCRWDTPGSDIYIGTYAKYIQQADTPATENAQTELTIIF